MDAQHCNIQVVGIILHNLLRIKNQHTLPEMEPLGKNVEIGSFRILGIDHNRHPIQIEVRRWISLDM